MTLRLGSMGSSAQIARLGTSLDTGLVPAILCACHVQHVAWTGLVAMANSVLSARLVPSQMQNAQDVFSA